MTLTRLTVPQAASRLRVSERTVWRRIRDGNLHVERVGRLVSVVVGATHPDAGSRRSWRSTGESFADYARLDPEGAIEGDRTDTVSVWPYTAENIERHRRALLARRHAAFEQLERLAAKSRPDPDGLTGGGYLRELRDPDWEPE